MSTGIHGHIPGTTALERAPIRAYPTGEPNGLAAIGVQTEAAIPVTPNVVGVVPASTSGSIPQGAKGFVFTALSGTVTLGGQTVPAGMTITSSNILGSALAYTTGDNSTAFVYYED